MEDACAQGAHVKMRVGSTPTPGTMLFLWGG